MTTPAPMHTLPLPPSLVRELRSDHAGEAGAVQIYRGILCLSREPSLREFAEQHMAAEQRHLAFFESWLTPQGRTRALPLWRLAGWLLGASAALGGPRLVYPTIEAVEQFVDEHYAAQINAMQLVPELSELQAILSDFRENELAHRDDAASRATHQTTVFLRAWAWLIDSGSRLGVVLARWL